MTAPHLSLNVVDGGLGTTGTNTDRLVAVFGASASGDTATPAYYSDTRALIDDFGFGPGTSAAAYIMATSGQGIIFARATSTPGSNGSITHTGSGAASFAASGTPNDNYSFLVTITKGADTIGLGTARANVSIDGGVTTLGNFGIAAGGTIVFPGTGVTLTFTTEGGGDLVAGDTYTFTSGGPVVALADLESCIAALPGFAATHSGLSPTLILDAGTGGYLSEDNGRSGDDVTELQTDVEALASAYEYARLITAARGQDDGESASTWAASIASNFSTVNALRCDVSAGWVSLYDPAHKCYMWRPLSWTECGRLASTKVHIDPAQVSLGGLPGVRAISHDERLNAGLDDARFTTTTTIVGQPGFFVTNGHLMAPPGSDYIYTQYGRVMDKICRVTYSYFIRLLSQSVLLNPTTGFIREAQAQAIEAGNDARLKAQVVADGNVSSAVTTVSRTDNLANPGATFHAQVSAVPLGYLKTIDVDLFFVASA